MPTKVNWTVECQQAFDTLKQAMCTAPVLKAPDYSKQFIVQTDASEHGIGAVLSQTNDDGLDQPVAFISRRLLAREQRWSAIEREAFAVVWSLKKLRPYLFGTHFVVQTDHRPLRWLMHMKGENPKLLMWPISLQGMDFIVEHRPGTAHANADGLSRFFHLENEDSLGKESDRGRHFDNEVIKLLCAALDIEQKLHCSYRPEASGLVEQMNGTLKSRMAKMCAATNMKWPDALPLVLMSMRNTPDKKTGLSPHEILMGRAMRLPAVPANALVNITDDMVLDYCKGLADVVRSFSHQVEANTLPPISDPGHNLQTGD
ncbi:hypothetical protein NDU88_001339 [Pleurodeles waltl]|uniref:Integrase catalytic domain-containing protein n=1 Tax=Pleurodeles waltl TaxID=8319 RepID=A0AAV7VYN9_PLEWA|nr:hypothetical protein NDU88_001339 [Pleurodeles waltl]